MFDLCKNKCDSEVLNICEQQVFLDKVQAHCSQDAMAKMQDEGIAQIPVLRKIFSGSLDGNVTYKQWQKHWFNQPEAETILMRIRRTLLIYMSSQHQQQVESKQRSKDLLASLSKRLQRLIIEVFDLCDLNKDRQIDFHAAVQVLTAQTDRDMHKSLQDFSQMVLAHYNTAKARDRTIGDDGQISFEQW